MSLSSSDIKLVARRGFAPLFSAYEADVLSSATISHHEGLLNRARQPTTILSNVLLLGRWL
jgi:hypothetical protein